MLDQEFKGVRSAWELVSQREFQAPADAGAGVQIGFSILLLILEGQL